MVISVLLPIVGRFDVFADGFVQQFRRTSWPALRNEHCTFDSEPRHFYSVVMPHQTEPNANKTLAVVIRGMLLSCRVFPETNHPSK